jgi:hypothetical protein
MRFKPFLGFTAVMTYAILGLRGGYLYIPIPHHAGLDLGGESVVWGFIFYCFIAAIFLVFTFPSTKSRGNCLTISKDPEGLAMAFGGFYTWRHYQTAFALIWIGALIMFAGLFYTAS